MNVYIQMPMDTPFRRGDIVLERGYVITNADDAGKAVHTALEPLFLRPALVAEAEDTPVAKAVDLSERLARLAKEVGEL